ncbi:MAG: hypothetical protein AAF561_03300 [Planctomycetota bacterium]
MIRTDSGLADWSGNAITKTGPNPTQFGLTEIFVSTYEGLRNTYIPLLTRVLDEAGHTQTDTLRKNQAKEALLNATLQMVQLVRANDTAPELLSELNLPVYDRNPTPAPIPSSAPEITLTAVSGTEIRVVARPDGQPDRRSKPDGVRQLAASYFIGDLPPTHQDGWSQSALFGRTSFELSVPTVPHGGLVWVTCRYINSRNQSGPTSAPVSIRLAGTNTPAASGEESSPMKIAA